jgi:leader peptidase (prepilin peptidase)/N-methyltransferase
MVELMSALMALCVFLRYGATIEAVVYYILISALLVITFIDLDFQIIPDVISLPGIPLGFLCSFFLPLKFTHSLLGILLGGGSLLLVAWLYEIIAKKEGMGGGDIKLLAMIGAFLGPKGVIFTIFISSVVGSLTGIILMFYMKKNMKMAVPFGPFLAIGAMAYIFFGPELINWYFNILR